MNVLALLSGLRQACDHISLVGSNGVVDFRDNVALKNSGLDQRSRELLQSVHVPAVQGNTRLSPVSRLWVRDESCRLNRILTLSANEDCAICLEVMKGPAVTPVRGLIRRRAGRGLTDAGGRGAAVWMCAVRACFLQGVHRGGAQGPTLTPHAQRSVDQTRPHH